jgi:hypothetical protein
MKILVLVASLTLASGLKAQDIDTAVKTMEVPAYLILNVNENLSAEKRHIEAGQITISRPNGNYRSLAAHLTLTCETGLVREAYLVLLDKPIVPDSEQSQLRHEGRRPLPIDAAVSELVAGVLDSASLGAKVLSKAKVACDSDKPAVLALSLWLKSEEKTLLVWTPLTLARLAELTR